ncbi:MAG: hypothetical protein IT287_08545, partial [Bdellovibrionaceae bacterium]|nr:hypothetical protein [Pseudobdellovibrionaceae bacterium]
VYGIYNRIENRIEMSSFDSQIVQNKEREHFSLKIKSLPIDVHQKNKLLKEMHLSIVIHELTHLFTQHNFKDDKPSPAIHEYFSYVIQLKSMSLELRSMILDKYKNTDFTNDMQINSMIHYGGPHAFGVMSYKHFQNLGDLKNQFIEDALTGHFRPDDLLEMLNKKSPQKESFK